MPDDRLRELERRCQETRAPADEEAWLRERDRRGLGSIVTVVALTLRELPLPLTGWKSLVHTFTGKLDSTACDPSWQTLERELVAAHRRGAVVVDLTAFGIEHRSRFVSDVFSDSGRRSLARRLVDISTRRSIPWVHILRPGLELFFGWDGDLPRYDSVDGALEALGWAGHERREVALCVDIPRWETGGW
ncbi:MAG: hypothetical protein R3F62_01505 [Planctomycetota bacterium]